MTPDDATLERPQGLAKRVFRRLTGPFALWDIVIQISSRERGYCQGDRVSGLVIVRSDEVDRTASSVRVELRESYEYMVASPHGVHRHKVSRVRDKVELAGPHRVPVGEVRRFSFEVQLPRNARLTEKTWIVHRCGWEVRGRARFRWWQFKRKTVELRVTPSRAFQVILAACQRGPGFVEAAWRPKWKSVKRPTRFKLLVPRHYAEDLRSINLELFEQENGCVRGTIVVQPQARGWAKLTHLIPGCGRVRQPFSLSRDEICLTCREPNWEAILGTVGRCLDKALAADR